MSTTTTTGRPPHPAPTPGAGETHLHRFELRAAPGKADARAQAILRQAQALGYGVSAVSTARVYFVQAALSADDLARLKATLLADPVLEQINDGVLPPGAGRQVVEVHPLPGVMDPAAGSIREAIESLFGLGAVQVSTGWRYDFDGLNAERAADLARALLANPAINQITTAPWTPTSLPEGREYTFALRTVPLIDLPDDRLAAFSREAHLFLSHDEMLAVRNEFRRLGRNPTDVELETIAQTWSEHCVHKTLKSRIRYREIREPHAEKSGAPAASPPAADRPGKQGTPAHVDFEFAFGRKTMPLPARRSPADDDSSDDNAPDAAGGAGGADVIAWQGRPGHTVAGDGSVIIENLLKSTVAAATFELIEAGTDWTLSVFKDNSGVIALDDDWGVCIKVETHNHPSAIEPYGGAATGIGGCIRDVIGTGLGAKPIANTDVFCVAMPDHGGAPLPPGCIEPRRVLTEVVAGVRDYGNRMGIPTLSGAVWFDQRYVGNPLVFCGCIGLIPRDKITGRARPGDRIIALGGRTGRDGIHGATFSSSEMEHTHADEFSHAVQIGNAIEEKRLLDAILRARDAAGGPLYTAITDCGAGGFSSAVGEMGSELGAHVHLERAPLKYAGLSYTEIWISEAQERMVLAVPPERVDALKEICAQEGVELADLGHFGTPDCQLILRFHDHEVGRLSMHFLHEGLPQPTREAVWRPAAKPTAADARGHKGPAPSPQESLLALLAHPNIASKHWIIRQYDHEVQGNTVTRPLIGPQARGPADAAVIEPVPGTSRGVAISAGLQTGVGDPSHRGDPYLMACAAVDECVRNLVCAGANPRRIAILDNFCWPSCDKPENLGALVRAAEGCYDAAKAYKTPFVSGKDSLNNQLRYQDPQTGEKRVIEIPPTLLITGLAHVDNIRRCITSDAKSAGNTLLLVGRTGPEMGGSHYQLTGRLEAHTFADSDDAAKAAAVPHVDLVVGPQTALAVAQLIRDGLIVSAHDCSDGGLLVAVTEMLIGAYPGEVARSGSTTAGSTAPATPAPAKEVDVSALLSSLLSPSLASLAGKSGTSASNPAPAALGAELTIWDNTLDAAQIAFAETPTRYVLEVRPGDLERVRTVLRDHGAIHSTVIGKLNASGRLTWAKGDLDLGVDKLAAAWLGTLDW